jgi:glyoxylase-like metal-dependent hydrolase (beta-lactamase superfamily II)
MERAVLPLQKLGNMELFQDGQAFTPEVSALATPGHTPGHHSFLISSGGQKGVVTGDVFHTPPQVQETGWNVGFDLDKPQAAKTRGSLMDRLEKEGFTVAAGHMPLHTNIGKVVRLEGKRVWQAL